MEQTQTLHILCNDGCVTSTYLVELWW